MLNGFFNEGDLVGLPDAKNYEKIDMVSPSIRAIVDRLRGLDNVPILFCYLQYV